MKPCKLKVEYRLNPLGIDVTRPRFSWQMSHQHELRGQCQTAYQVIVCDEEALIVWDSGKVSSGHSLHVTYAGRPLQPRTRYKWRVLVWDQNGQVSENNSWFETGLLNADIAAWDGAQWIGGGDTDIPLYADYLPLYNLSVDIKIEPGSHRAGVIIAANDPRFLDRFKNIYQNQSAENQTYFKVELDVSGLDQQQGHALINVYRVGYTLDDDPAVPVEQFKVKQSVIHQGNRHTHHHLLIHNEYGTLTIQLDDDSEFYTGALPPAALQAFSEKARAPMIYGAKAYLNREGGDHDSLPYGMLNSIGFSVDPGQQAKFKNLQVRNIHRPNSLLFSEQVASPYDGLFSEQVDNHNFSTENDHYTLLGGVQGAFIVANPSHNGMPVLRSEFDLQRKGIAKARLYITARGIYEFYINGRRIGNDYYNPGLTQYNLTHLYQTFDITSAIKPGRNAMGALLAEGWWSGLLSYGNTWNGFGDRQSLLAKLIVTFEDGSEAIYKTDDQNWQFFNQGPLIYSSLTMGEVYDATKESRIAGWSEAGFNTRGWQPAQIVPLKGSATSGSRPNLMIEPQHLNYDNMQLIGQVGESAGVYKALPAKSVKEVRPGVFVYDLGQNIVGVPKITFENGREGHRITLRFAEMLYPDLPESGPNVGMIMTENYRSALSQDIYVMRDGKQCFQPRFTSHGFQYIEITGIEEALPLDAVSGLAISSISQLTAGYETSCHKINKLWSNIVWSNIDNFLSVPTDCPQRNERMGWTGDINVFGRTATYISDSSQFLRRYLQSMRDTQAGNGRYPDIAPIGGGFGGVLWGSAGITLPWEAYRQFGDLGLLQEHYSSMIDYMDFLDSVIDSETGFITDDGLGDWLGPQEKQLGSAYPATAYHIYVLNIMRDVASLLGDNDHATRFSQQYAERKTFFNKTFVSADNKPMGWLTYGNIWQPSDKTPEFKVADTQSAYAVGLALGAFDASLVTAMADNLKHVVSRKNTDDSGVERPEFSLMTGFIGTAWIADALSENGHSDIAYKLIQSETFPSWLYPVNQGATTIWERLNGFTIENGFGGNNSMNSFNHYSFGAVGQWMMGYSAGIQREEPGFKTFVLEPQIDRDGGIDKVTAFYDSPYGRIESQWLIEGNQLRYNATVPANTSATLHLPAVSICCITESDQSLLDCDGITKVEEHADKVTLRLASGSYSFVSQLPH